MKEKEPEEENIPIQMLEFERQGGAGSTCPCPGRALVPRQSHHEQGSCQSQHRDKLSNLVASYLRKESPCPGDCSQLQHGTTPCTPKAKEKGRGRQGSALSKGIAQNFGG